MLLLIHAGIKVNKSALGLSDCVVMSFVGVHLLLVPSTFVLILILLCCINSFGPRNMFLLFEMCSFKHFSDWYHEYLISCGTWVECCFWLTVKSLIYGHFSRQWNCRSLRCSWSIACRCCSNYIFILDLTPGLKGLHKGHFTTRWGSFKFLDLVRLILDFTVSQKFRLDLWRAKAKAQLWQK